MITNNIVEEPSYLGNNSKRWIKYKETLSVTTNKISSDDNDKRDWCDFQYRYDDEVDILVLYFKKVMPGLVEYTNDEFLDKGILIDHAQDGKIICIEIMDAEKKTICDFWNGNINDTIELLSMKATYDEASDVYILYFVSECKWQHEVNLNEPVVLLETTIKEKNILCGLKINNASKILV